MHLGHLPDTCTSTPAPPPQWLLFQLCVILYSIVIGYPAQKGLQSSRDTSVKKLNTLGLMYLSIIYIYRVSHYLYLQLCVQYKIVFD